MPWLRPQGACFLQPLRRWLPVIGRSSGAAAAAPAALLAVASLSRSQRCSLAAARGCARGLVPEAGARVHALRQARETRCG
jgi:hypothetical protein